MLPVILTAVLCNPKHSSIHTYIHPFNGPFSGTTRVSRYEKGKTNLDLTEARDSEWQWHQLDHMQVCTLLQADNHASTPPLSFFYRPDALADAQPTASKHWRWSTAVYQWLIYFLASYFLQYISTPVYQWLIFLTSYFQLLVNFVPEPKKRAWRHGRAWKMKTRAWKNQDPCFNFYKQV